MSSTAPSRSTLLKRFAGPICTLLLVGGAVAAIVSINAQGKMKQGAAAPDSVKAKSNDIMIQRQHGTCISEVQNPLRWNSDVKVSDNICCFNRHYAEYAGYWTTTTFLSEQRNKKLTIFYDSVTGKKLFQAPIGRTWEEFEKESLAHGWPSFRDAEVITNDVRVLEDGEVVSLDGTHLGHNLPDSNGNRYCINIVSIAGVSDDDEMEKEKEKEKELAD